MHGVVPYAEMGAYEALFDQQGMSFTRLAKLFRESGAKTPTDLVDSSTAADYASRALAELRSKGIRRFGIKVHGAGEYPLRLRDAKSPVELLYYRGWWNLLESRCIAIVGSRNPSEEGVLRAAQLTKNLVQDDFTIVSGLARGIDTAAHTTALEEKGRTVAVLGTPLSETYPRENKQLLEKIAEEFLVISQVPVCRHKSQSFRQNRLFFPERNKTMSAISEATIIVEAGETSGTLVQARAALEQGRKLYILDNCFRNKEITWPEKYERKGAIRISNYTQLRELLFAATAHTDKD